MKMSAPRGTHTGPISEWSVREQLILASAVQRSGDQNWVSVSRAVKPLIEDARPPDYFSQKNCALQYSAMLDKASTPKRKRSSDGSSEAVETVEEQIVRQLTEKRINDLNESLAETKEEYLSLKREIEQIERGELDSQLPAIWERMQAEMAKEEAEAKAKEATAPLQKIKSPPASSQARLHEQLKPKIQRAQPPYPQEVGVARANEADKIKKAEKVEPKLKEGSSGILVTKRVGEAVKQQVEKIDTGLPIKEPKISPDVKEESAAMTATPSHRTPTDSGVVGDESPLPRLITSPKEEKFRVPMQVPQPSTEASLSSDIHIIVQQPNIAVSRVEASHLPLATVSNSKVRMTSAPSTSIPSSTPHVAMAKVEHAQTSPSVSKTASAIKVVSPTQLLSKPQQETKPPLLQQPLGKLAPTPVTSKLEEHKPTPVAKTALPSTVTPPTSQQGPVPSSPPVSKGETRSSPPVSNKAQPAVVTSSPVRTSTSMTTPSMPALQTSKFPSYTTLPPVLTPHTTPPLVPPPTTFPSAPPPTTLPSVPPPTTLPSVPPPTTLPSAPPPTTLPSAPLPTTLPSTPSPTTLSSAPPPTTLPSASPPTFHTTLPPEPPPHTAPPPPTTLSPTPPSHTKLPPVPPPHTTLPPVPPPHTTPSPVPPPHTIPSPVPPPHTTLLPVTPPHTTVPPVPPPTTTVPPVTPPTTTVPPVPPPTTTVPPVTPPTATLPPVPPPTTTLPPVPPPHTTPPPVPPPTTTPPPVPPHLTATPSTPPSHTTPPPVPPPTTTPPPVPPHLTATPSTPPSHTTLPPAPPPLIPTPPLKESKPPISKEQTVVRTTPSPNKAPPKPPPQDNSKSVDHDAPPQEERMKKEEEEKTAEKMEAIQPKKKEQKAAEKPPPLQQETKPATVEAKVEDVPGEPQEEPMETEEPQEAKPLVPAPEQEKQPASPKPTTSLPPPPPLTPTIVVSEVKPTPSEAQSPKSPLSPSTSHSRVTRTRSSRKDAGATDVTEQQQLQQQRKIATPTPVEPKPTPVEPKPTLVEPKSPPLPERGKPASATPREKEKEKEEGGEKEEEEETHVRSRKSHKTPFKKQWVTRSRKRKADLMDEGPSVESTDMESEEEPTSTQISAVPSPAPSQGDAEQESMLSQKQWRKAIMLVWRHAAQHKYANLFLHPVKEDDAPGYRDVIFRPMDLSTIKKHIETGVIKTDTEFQRDILLMFQNAFMYNSSDHDVYQMAEEMRKDVMESIQDYLATQMQLLVETAGTKVLRSGGGRRGELLGDENVFSPAKKRRTRADDL